MNFKKNTVTVKSRKNICEKTNVHPVTASFVLPDYYPDVSRIMKTSANATVLSWNTKGKNLSYELLLKMTVLYKSSESELIQSFSKIQNISGTAELEEECENPVCIIKLGAHVVYESMYEVHVSGHACQEELKLIYTLAKPKFYIPVHGEYKHLVKNAELAKKLGCPPENVLIGDIGNVIETDGATMKVVSQVQSGKVLVDGFGVGDVGSIVLRDRKHLSQDGIIIVVVSIDRASGIVVSGPEIISRGFVYVRESEELMDESRQLLGDALSRCSSQELREWNALKTKLRDTLSDYIYEKTKRSPMILPIIMEI